MRRTWIMAALLLTACGGAEPSTSGSGGSGASGSGAAGGTGGGGVGGGGGGTGGGTSECHGDAAVWQGITKTNIACERNSDCCVVVSSCLAETQVVHASDFRAAQAAWPWCDDDCANCLPAYVEVVCAEGTCIGYGEDPEATPQDPTSHCGDDDVSAVPATPPAEHFTCGG
jgi:hypothetical protein